MNDIAQKAADDVYEAVTVLNARIREAVACNLHVTLETVEENQIGRPSRPILSATILKKVPQSNG